LTLSPIAIRSPVDQEAPLSPTEVLEWEEYFRKGRQDRDR
jgi:hypothetical protein